MEREKQSKKRRNNFDEMKQKEKYVDDSDDYEDISEEGEENEQEKQINDQIQKPKNKKKKNNKSVKFEEKAYDDLKEKVDVNDLQYEDDFYDEYEQEEVNDEEEKKDMEDEEQNVKPKVFLGTDKELKEDEELDFENRAYEMFHRANIEWPCLSCDFLLPSGTQYTPQNPNFQQAKLYPLELYLTAGSQTGQQQNYIYFMKMSNLYKTKYDDDSDYQPSDDEGEDDEPKIFVESVPIKNNVNRIRSMQHSPIVAYWTDNGEVSILDGRDRFSALCGGSTEVSNYNDNFTNIKCSTKTFKNSQEGYALDWNNLKVGYLLSGSCDGKIHLYHPKNDNFSDIVRVSNPYLVHKDSVEDLQWSPAEPTEFASCSVDGTVQIVDIRTQDKTKSQIKIKAHSVDVNVISWCSYNKQLIASGADNGEVKVWDKRYTKNPYSEIDFHKSPITSIQFQPNDESTLAVSSADNRLTIWDFAAENDDGVQDDEEIPEQLMFIHQGQKDIKELRYHPLYYELLVSTALDGINVFKPNLDASDSSIRSETEQKEDIPEVNEKDLESYLNKLSIK